MKGRRNSSRRKPAADRGGSVSVENAIVFGLLIVLTIALIEFSLALWQWNTAEKATELGVRYAVQSDPVAADFREYNAVTQGVGYNAGTNLDEATMPPFTVTCNGTTCWRSAGTLPGGFSTTHDIAAFNEIRTRMDGVFRGVDLQVDNIEIDYSHVGMGFAGRPGPDIVPVVTVRLTGVTFDFMILSFIRPLMFYGSVQPTSSGFPMPPFTATLSGEDMYSKGTPPQL